MWSVAGMTVALVLLGAGFALRADEAGAGGALGRITAISLMIYIAFFAIGLGPVFWLLIAEIYPIKMRAVAMSAATVANWAANYVVAASFLTMAGFLGQGRRILVLRNNGADHLQLRPAPCSRDQGKDAGGGPGYICRAKSRKAQKSGVRSSSSNRLNSLNRLNLETA